MLKFWTDFTSSTFSSFFALIVCAPSIFRHWSILPRSSQTSEREKFDEKLPRVEKSVTKNTEDVCVRDHKILRDHRTEGVCCVEGAQGPGHSLDEQEQKRELMENVSDIKRKRVC